MKSPIVLNTFIHEPRLAMEKMVYAHLNFGFARLEDGKLSYFPYYDTKSPLHLASLYVSCQIDGDPKPDDWGESYGWEIAYDSSLKIGLDRVEAMHRTLKAIDRRYKKIAPTGSHSFGEYVGAIAQCVKAKSIYLPDGTLLDFPFVATSWVNDKVKELRSECCRKQTLYSSVA